MRAGSGDPPERQPVCESSADESVTRSCSNSRVARDVDAGAWNAHLVAAAAGALALTTPGLVGLDWYADEPSKIPAGGYDALIATGKPFGFTEFGPDIAKSFTSHDLPTMLDGLKTNAPKADFFWHWQSSGGRKMALVDLQNAKAGLEDPQVLNCGDLDFPTVDGGSRGRCAALDALPRSSPKGCGCQATGSLAGLVLLLAIGRRRRG